MLLQTLSLIRWLHHSLAVERFLSCHCQVAGLIYQEKEVTVTFSLLLANSCERTGYKKHLVCLPCTYLFIHAWSFVLGVTQACITQSSNKLKIAPAEISTSYFPAGVQSRLCCLSQNI